MQSPVSKSSPSGPDIPQEIIDLVVDKIADSEPTPDIDHSNEVSALRICAHVSKAFQISARRHFFGSIAIVYDKSTERRVGMLRKTLEVNPGLVSLIRRLTIILSDDYDPSLSEERQSLPKRLSTLYKRQKYKLLELVKPVGENLAWFLQRLSQSDARLTTLGISGRWGSLCSSWNRFPERISAILLSIIQSNPHLETLNLTGIVGLPTSIFVRTEGQTFRNISVMECAFFPTKQPSSRFSLAIILTPESPLELQNLESLIIRRSGIFGDSPELVDTETLPVLDFPRLELVSLGMDYSSRDIALLCQIMTGNSPSLKRLHITLLHLRSTLQPHAFPAVINNLAALEELSIFNIIKVTTTIGLQRMLRAISTFLTFPILPTTIETVIIEVSCHACIVYNMDPSELMLSFKDGLTLVDDVLCDRTGRFPRLRKVDINLFIHGHGGIRCDDVSNCNDQSVLPRLASSGLVAVNFTFRFLHRM